MHINLFIDDIFSYFQDIAAKLLSLSQQRPRALCILSGTGIVSSVTLRQPASTNVGVTYEVKALTLPPFQNNCHLKFFAKNKKSFIKLKNFAILQNYPYQLFVVSHCHKFMVEYNDLKVVQTMLIQGQNRRRKIIIVPNIGFYGFTKELFFFFFAFAGKIPNIKLVWFLLGCGRWWTIQQNGWHKCFSFQLRWSCYWWQCCCAYCRKPNTGLFLIALKSTLEL